MRSRICNLILIAALAVAFVSLAFGEETLFEIKQQEFVLPVGGSETLSISLDSTIKKKGIKLSWQSSDEAIIKVNKAGKVTGQAPGTARVFCDASMKDGETLHAETEIRVTQQVTKLTIVPESPLEVGVGNSFELSCGYEPESAEMTDVEWSVANTDIAQIDSQGKLTGLKTGRTRVTAKAKDGFGASDTVNLTVGTLYAKTEEITLEKPEEYKLQVFFQQREKTDDEQMSPEEQTESDPEQEWFETNYTVLQEGTGFSYDLQVVGNTAEFTLRPVGISEENHLIVRDRKNPQFQTDILIHVKESAICDAQKLPFTSAELLTGTGILVYRMELTNNSEAEIGEIGFVVDYRDQFGDPFYLYSNSDGTIQNHSYTTKFNIQPGETLPLLGRTDAFRSDDIITEVRVAINYYRYVESGRKVYIPDNQLYWYSTKTGEMDRPEKSVNYEYPDEEMLDLAERINFKLRATTCDLYSYVVKRFSRSKFPGKYIASVGDGGWASQWGLEPMDVVYGADDMLWADDPFFLERAFARIYQGETVMLKVIRNGEELELPASNETPSD